MGVEDYEALNRRLSILEGSARGEKAIDDGRSLTHEDAKRRMTRWLS